MGDVVKGKEENRERKGSNNEITDRRE